MKKATLLPLRRDEDGRLDAVIGRDDGSLALGRFSPMAEGRPIHDLARVAEVSPREGSLLLDATFPFAEAEVEAEAAPEADSDPAAAEEEPAVGRKGPARVNSAAYRDAWERIFGRKPAGDA
jgi:hypothetical protein